MGSVPSHELFVKWNATDICMMESREITLNEIFVPLHELFVEWNVKWNMKWNGTDTCVMESREFT